MISEVISHCGFNLHFSDNYSVEHLSTCLLAISISSLEKCLFKFSDQFLIRFFVFLILSCVSWLYILGVNSLLVSSFASIFSHSVGYLFISLMVSIAVQKLNFD